MGGKDERAMAAVYQPQRASVPSPAACRTAAREPLPQRPAPEREWQRQSFQPIRQQDGVLGEAPRRLLQGRQALARLTKAGRAQDSARGDRRQYLINITMVPQQARQDARRVD